VVIRRNVDSLTGNAVGAATGYKAPNPGNAEGFLAPTRLGDLGRGRLSPKVQRDHPGACPRTPVVRDGAPGTEIYLLHPAFDGEMSVGME